MDKRIRGNKYGRCCLCGHEGKLTYEHIPPQTTFNNQRVKIVLEDTIRVATYEQNRKPWEIDELKYISAQRGIGGYYLCEKCNNNTGAEYVPHYERFANALGYVNIKTCDETGDLVKVELKDIRPLPVLKEIMLMFCNINEGDGFDDKAIEFIKNRDNQYFDDKKYRVFLHMHVGEFSRMVPFNIKINVEDGSSAMVSEICMFPLGISLYINLEDDLRPVGTEITSFANYKYDEICDLEIMLMKYECNTTIAEDYRKKEEILQTK